MSRRMRHPMAGPQVVDLETARRAVAQVAAERDALSRQLERSQSAVGSLRRQLDAREQENAHLAHALRAVEARHDSPDPARLEQMAEERRELLAQLRESEREREHLREARAEALAARDAERAARQAAEAAAIELRDCAPEADRIQRLAADLENVRRRQATAIRQGVEQQTDHLLVAMASVRDSVQRAIDALPETSGAWYDGLLAVLARIDSVLAREGVSRTGARGEHFDPQLHEAVGTVDGDAPNLVRETVSSGLVREDGRVVVPAKVLVTA
ncbi:MAG: nucleotide exchange factor GrpE [Deltaproteobacteria bacterium]|nr:MAG: nucleotide exchange factor GrpE [Deltaproteobacteria bacterium]